MRRNIFSNKAVDSWNQIPSEVKKARNVGMFKTEETILNPSRGPGRSNLNGEKNGVTRRRYGEPADKDTASEAGAIGSSPTSIQVNKMGRKNYKCQ